MPYSFFFSYAASDVKHGLDDHMGSFYKELAEEVRSLSGGRDPDPGFWAPNRIETGDQWPQRVDEALQNSRVLVCAYSPTFFNSEYCGRELEIFRRRQRRYADAHPGASPAPVILPVLWTPLTHVTDVIEALPDDVRQIQRVEGRDPDRYRTAGLRSIMRRRPTLNGEYFDFLEDFAGRVLEVGRGYPLPPLDPFPRLLDVPSAFHQQARPGLLRFFVVAPTSADAAALGRRANPYGEVALDWQPYGGGLTARAIVTEVASIERLASDQVSAADDLLGQLTAASDRRVLIVVLDPWALLVQQQRAILRVYDDTTLSNCAVLVAFDKGDEETRTRYEQLDAIVRETFPRKVRIPKFVKLVYGSADDLRAQLLATISELRGQVLAAASAAEVVPAVGPELIGKATISGTTSSRP